MRTTMGPIVGIGEVLWDMLPAGKKLGGAPANFTYHVNALGGQGVLISRVGNDALGREACRLLDRQGLTLDHVSTDFVHPTGSVLAELDEQGRASYMFPPDVAWDFLDMGPETGILIPDVRAVCFGTLAQRSAISRATIQEFLDLLPATTLKIFDINLRSTFYTREIIHSSLQRADVLKISDEELPVLADMLGIGGDDRAVLTALATQYDLDLCALTRGAQGSLLMSREEHHEHPGLPVRMKDTIGAGDSFTAALTLGLLAGWGLEAINERANEVAAAVCAHAGGMPVLPDSLRILP